MIRHIQENVAMPVYWAANQKGMQAVAEIPDPQLGARAWRIGTKECIERARILADLGLHKAICNRRLEADTHMTTLVTATDFNNFFALRAHPDAQQEFQALAYKMLGLYLHNTPAMKEWDEWHLPYYDEQMDTLSEMDKVKICVARACRTSYTKFDGVFSIEGDLALHDSALAKKHMSPFEHPAVACPGRWGNFSGWKQYRKMIEGENQTDVDLHAIYANRPEWVDRV
jgi:hypothetical protein